MQKSSSKGIALSRNRQTKKREDYSKEFITASFFGFLPTQTPSIEKQTLFRSKQITDPLLSQNNTPFPFKVDLVEKIAFLEHYEIDRWDSLPSPIMVSYRRPIAGSEHRKSSDTIIGLEMFGTSGSIAEALVIRTALSILEDEGETSLTISLNSIGDKDSVSDYERMLNTYLKKNGATMPADLKKKLRDCIFYLPSSKQKEFEKWRLEAPKSMSFLSENSRRHFKEVVEYVESFGIPYEIDTTLLGSPYYGVHTVFEIKNADGEVLSCGYRYSRLSKKMGLKKDIPAITATVRCKKGPKNDATRPLPKPKFYLVQLGMGAKAEALQVIEMLRKAKIAIGHSLSKDKLQSQIGTAENMKVSHILLIGQKEALERTVVVRNNETRSQESVPLDSLVSYLKNLN
jgi:histidyl-tRNA synthetase